MLFDEWNLQFNCNLMVYENWMRLQQIGMHTKKKQNG